MTTQQSPASRAGLAPWQRADLPPPPMPRGLQWIGVCGPGVIVLGVSIGSGEFLLGPAVFVKHGLTLLWVTLVAVFFQTVFNTELMRYTVATGEPVVTGFMRTRPGRTFWAWSYALLYFLQVGWPAWAATAAGAFFFLFAGRMATLPADSTATSLIGAGTFLACVAVLLVGKRIARTLEVLNWALVAVILGGFLVLAVVGSLSMDARRRSDSDGRRFASLTSHVPFVAIAQGRNRLAVAAESPASVKAL